MKKLVAISLVLLSGFIVLNSCAPEEEFMPKEASPSNVNSNHNALLKSALKFEAVHQVPMIPGGEIPPPEFISSNGNRFRFKASIMTVFTEITPSEATVFLSDGTIIATMEAFWKVPDSDPLNIMQGTGPAKGEFVIERAGEIIWEGTIVGTRINLGTIEEPLFRWKGHIKATGVGIYEGLKLTASETTEPSPYPAMTYFWSGVITPNKSH